MDKQVRYWYYTMSADKDLTAGAGAASLAPTLITETRVTYLKVSIFITIYDCNSFSILWFAEFDIQ